MLDHVSSAAVQRRFCVTTNGYLGLVSGYSRPGDQIYIFLGGKTPSVLMDGEFSSLLVGSAYVDGLMNGEALEEDWWELRDIVLR